jgi:hypothetical protein
MCSEIKSAKSLSFASSSRGKTRTLPNPINVSVAGLKNREDLENALFAASAKWTNSAIAKAGGVFARALLRNGGFDPSEIKLRAEFSGRNAIVCLDDVERFSGDHGELFGFVIDLLDLHGAHVVLICAEESMTKPELHYSQGRERVVGYSGKVRIGVQDLVDSTIACLARSTGLDNLKKTNRELATIFEIAGLQNRRLAIAVVRVIRDLLDGFSDQDFQSIIPTHFYASIILVVLAKSTMPNCEEQLKQIFGAGSAFKIRAFTQGAELNSREMAAKDLVERVGLRELFYLIEASQSMIALASGEDCDKELLLAEFRSGRAFSGAPAPRVEDALQNLEGWERLESDEIERYAMALKSALTGDDNLTFRQLERIIGMARALDAWRLIDNGFGFESHNLLQAIEVMDGRRIVGEIPDLLGPHDGLESPLSDALKSLYSRVCNLSKNAMVKAAVDSFKVGKMSAENSVNLRFSEEDLRSVSSSLLSVSAADVKELIRSIKRFNIREAEGESRGFSALVGQLRSEVPAVGRLTPSQAMVLRLAEELENRRFRPDPTDQGGSQEQND